MINYFLCNIGRDFKSRTISDLLNCRYSIISKKPFRLKEFESSIVDDIYMLSTYKTINLTDIRYNYFIGPIFSHALRLKINKSYGFMYDLVKCKGNSLKQRHIQTVMFFIGA